MTGNQQQRNWEAFLGLGDDVKTQNIGRTALLHDGELIDIYNDSGDAYTTGVSMFGLGNFSTQTFGVEPRSLGFFTMSVPVQSNKEVA